MSIAKTLDTELMNAIAAGGTEPQIIKRYANAAATIQPTKTVKVKAGFIHQRPYVFFVKPLTIAGKTKCELGDIMYVFKQIDAAGKLLAARVAFVQAKKGTGSWHVEPHQLEFLKNIRKTKFKFGNSVYKNGNVKPIIYDGLPHQGKLAQYLLMDQATALSYSVARVAQHQPVQNSGGFTLSRGNAITCGKKEKFCLFCDSHLMFIERFCDGEEGARLSNKVRDIVELIYKSIGWVLDPPEEFANNFDGDGDGEPFAIVEITLTVDPDEQKRVRGR